MMAIMKMHLPVIIARCHKVVGGRLVRIDFVQCTKSRREFITIETFTCCVWHIIIALGLPSHSTLMQLEHFCCTHYSYGATKHIPNDHVTYINYTLVLCRVYATLWYDECVSVCVRRLENENLREGSCEHVWKWPLSIGLTDWPPVTGRDDLCVETANEHR